MNTLTQELIELLSLEKIEENVYRGISRNLVGKRVLVGKFWVRLYAQHLIPPTVLHILYMLIFYMAAMLTRLFYMKLIV